MEWTSLIVFTVLAEAAVGLVLLYTLFGFTAAARDKASAYGGLGRTVLLTSALTTALAMLVSLTHLGWPLSAFRALGGLPSSWLSWEVLLTGLFAGGAVALWATARRPAWAWVGLSVIGLAGTYASGMVYALPSAPVNAGGFPPLLFLASALVAGPALLLLLLAVTAPGKELAPGWMAPLALTAVGAILLTGVLTLAYGGAAAGYTASAWHPIRLVAGLLLPALLLLVTARRPKLSLVTAALPVLLLVAGELAGRMLFFTSTVFTSSQIGM